MKQGDTPTIGDIPTGFPELITPTIDASLIIQMIISATTLASLGAIDSLLTSLVADNKTKKKSFFRKVHSSFMY